MPSDTPLPFDAGPDFPWILPGENPWNITVLDLRRVALGVMSTTLNPAVAETFATPRTGEEYLTASLPVDCPVPRGLTIPIGPTAGSGPLAVAAEMEDKWNIYLHESRLFFARSWTGALVHSATLALSDGMATVTAIQTHDAEDGADHAAREVDYLIESYLLGYLFPHPVPAWLDRSFEAVLAYSFGTHGRRGLFATYDDTLAATHPSRVGREQ